MIEEPLCMEVVSPHLNVNDDVDVFVAPQMNTLKVVSKDDCQDLVFL